MLSNDEIRQRDYWRSKEDLVCCFPNTYSLSTIEVGFGWHGLLADLGQELESAISKWQPDIGSWSEENNHFIKPHVTRISIKYGQMCVKLIGDVDSNMIEMVQRYELKSLSVCEYCGNQGKLKKRSSFQIVTCDKH